MKTNTQSIRGIMGAAFCGEPGGLIM